MILAVTAFPTGKSYAASVPESASGDIPHGGFVAIPSGTVTPNNACISPEGVGDSCAMAHRTRQMVPRNATQSTPGNGERLS